MGLFDDYEKADDLYRKKDDGWVGVVIGICVLVGLVIWLG